MGKRVLVTGGAGFLGSHLCERLLGDGDDVFCLDNLATGSLENITHLRTHIAFKMLHHDVCFPFYGEVDQIYHLACPSDPTYCTENPVETTKTHIVGGLHLLDLARRCQAPILLASSGKLNHNPEPTSAIVAKQCAENLFLDYGKKHGVKVKIARIYECYGPRMPFTSQSMVGQFIFDALQNKTLNLLGDGSEKHSICYYSDVISALVSLMRSERAQEPLNIGHPDDITIKELAKKIIALANSSSKTKKSSKSSPSLCLSAPNVTKTKKMLGWKPATSLDEGLKTTLDFFTSL